MPGWEDVILAAAFAGRGRDAGRNRPFELDAQGPSAVGRMIEAALVLCCENGISLMPAASSSQWPKLAKQAGASKSSRIPIAEAHAREWEEFDG